MNTSRHRTMPRGLVASIGLAAILVVGCNTTLTLDNDRLQTVIAQGFQEQTNVSAEVVCPDSQPLKQGAVFNCVATTADGQQLTIQVTQTDNAGNVNWKVI